MRNLQRRVAELIELYRQAEGLDTGSAASSGALASFGAEVLNFSRVGAAPPDHNWQEELGETAFALLVMAASTDVDLQSAMERAVDRYTQVLTEQADATTAAAG